MRTNRMFLLGFCWLLAGCQTATPPPTPPPSQTPSPRPTATITVQPSPVATATVALSSTPTPVPLSETGPYLFTLHDTPTGQVMLVVDQEGLGQAQISLPDGYSIDSLDVGLSPTGEFLAVYAGTAEGERRPFDLRLGLYELRSGRLTTEIRLLNDGYPANVDALRGEYQFLNPRAALRAGIRSLAWSRNGRYLAFAGQIDGPSSDLYVLDVKTGQRRRLTDGNEQIVWLEWAADGRHILHASTNQGGPTTPTNNLFSADVQSDSGVALGSARGGNHRWIDPDHILVYSDAINERFDRRDAFIVNVETGERFTVWKADYGALQLDWPLRQATVVGCLPDTFDEATGCGEYRVDLVTQAVEKTRTVNEARPLRYDDGQVWVDENTLEDRAGNRLVILLDAIRIFPSRGDAIASFIPNAPIKRKVEGFTLSPNARWAFVTQDDHLVAVEISTGASTVIVRDYPVEGTFEYRWIAAVPGRGAALAPVPEATPWGAEFGPTATSVAVNAADSGPALVRVPVEASRVSWASTDTVTTWSGGSSCTQRDFAVTTTDAGVSLTGRGDERPCPPWDPEPLPPKSVAEPFGFAADLVQSASYSSDGQRLLVVTDSEALGDPILSIQPQLSGDFPTYTQAWIIDVATGAKTLIAATARWLSFQWGFDERFLVAVGGDCYGGNGMGGVYTIELADPRLTPIDPTYAFCEGSLPYRHAPNSAHVLTQHGLVVDYAGQVLIDVCPTDTFPRAQVWSDDGRFVYAACGPDGPRTGYDVVRRYELATGDLVELTSPSRVPLKAIDLVLSPDGRYLAFEWGSSNFFNDEPLGWFVLDTLLVGD